MGGGGRGDDHRVHVAVPQEPFVVGVGPGRRVHVLELGQPRGLRLRTGCQPGAGHGAGQDPRVVGTPQSESDETDAELLGGHLVGPADYPTGAWRLRPAKSPASSSLSSGTPNSATPTPSTRRTTCT